MNIVIRQNKTYKVAWCQCEAISHLDKPDEHQVQSQLKELSSQFEVALLKTKNHRMETLSTQHIPGEKKDVQKEIEQNVARLAEPRAETDDLLKKIHEESR